MTVDGLICPCCDADALQPDLMAWRCEGCEQTFPLLGGIPMLLRDADKRLRGWSEGLSAFAAQSDEAVRQLLVQSVQEGLLPRTRERLTTVASGLEQHAKRVANLFVSAGLTTTHQPASGAKGEAIQSYYTLVHRDWGWAPEVDEVTPALEALVGVLPPGFVLGRTLVLGAGTARLAWELGNRVKSNDDIVAIDVNPLPFLVTKRLMNGEAISMFELPGHPRRSTLACSERTLRATTPAPKGLTLLFADGLKPPVRDGAFDTVLTPWFVDQVPEDLATLPAMIRRVLRPGGTWLNQGPFVYDPVRTKPAHRYCADEFIHIVNGSGFTVSKATYAPQVHMASPVSGQGRSEWVLTMHATASAPAPTTPVEPAWLLSSGAEVLVPTLGAASELVARHPLVGVIARMVDGTRSARAIAATLVARGELSPEGAVEAVQACLRVLWAAQKR